VRLRLEGGLLTALLFAQARRLLGTAQAGGVQVGQTQVGPLSAGLLGVVQSRFLTFGFRKRFLTITLLVGLLFVAILFVLFVLFVVWNTVLSVFKRISVLPMEVIVSCQLGVKRILGGVLKGVVL